MSTDSQSAAGDRANSLNSSNIDGLGRNETSERKRVHTHDGGQSNDVTISKKRKRNFTKRGRNPYQIFCASVQTPESVHDGKLNIGQRNKETARLWKELEPQAKQLYKEMAQTEKKGLSSTCTNRGTDLMQCHAALVTDFIKHSVKEARKLSPSGSVEPLLHFGGILAWKLSRNSRVNVRQFGSSNVATHFLSQQNAFLQQFADAVFQIAHAQDAVNLPELSAASSSLPSFQSLDTTRSADLASPFPTALVSTKELQSLQAQAMHIIQKAYTKATNKVRLPFQSTKQGRCQWVLRVPDHPEIFLKRNYSLNECNGILAKRHNVVFF